MTIVGRTLLAAALVGTSPGLAQTPPPSSPSGLVHLQPDPSDAVKPYVVDPAASRLTRDETIAALRSKVRYVFVIFNENHSFDNEYGAFPGVDGLFSDGVKPRAAEATPGFVQRYTDWQGVERTARPFRIGPEQNATFTDSVDHSHKGLAKKIDVGPYLRLYGRTVRIITKSGINDPSAPCGGMEHANGS